MKACIYARVSSEKQVDKDLSIKAQIKELKKYAAANGHLIVNIFVDEAKSAKTANRPAFQDMINHVRQKNPPFELILVWKLSRFARKREDSIVYKSLLRKKGIQVVSINEQIDDTPAGKMLEGILEVVDEFYSNNLSSDTVRGMKENASRGYYNGGIIPLGYRPKKIKVGTNNKSKYEIDPTSSKIIKDIYDMYLKGNGAKDIAMKLNKKCPALSRWSKNRILYILKNEAYTGTFVWNKNSSVNDNNVVRVKGSHPAIIAEKDFLKVQKMIYSRRPKTINPKLLKTENILNGLIYCGSCKKAFSSNSAKSGNFHYYLCSTKSKSGKSACNQKALNVDKFDSFIIKVIKDRIITEENVRKLVHLVREELESLIEKYTSDLIYIDHALEDKKKRVDKLFDTIETSDLDISDITPRIKRLNAEIEKLEEDKAKLELRISRNDFPDLDDTELEPYIKDFTRTLNMGSLFEKKSFIRSFIKRIWIDYPTATIEYTVPINKGNGPDNGKKEVLALAKNGLPSKTTVSQIS
jgi:site-specific DNA recombinase